MSQQAFFDSPPVAEPATDSDEEYRAAMSRAGSILARRSHSQKELKDKLGGLGPEIADRVLDRLSALGILDDEAFAEEWVESNRGRKGLEALRAGLSARGIDAEIVDRVLERAAVGEQGRANLIATRYLPRVIERPLPAQAAALLRTLLGRGFSREVAEAAVRATLPPEGWD
ncbi:MAG: regulatory protein RecX [Actinomycetota bacterium]